MALFNRFNSGLPDPQDTPVLAKCSMSGAEFYNLDDKCYFINGKIVHPEEVVETTVGDVLEVLEW